ncbi:MAG: guanylate kinase [Nitrospirae bacterium]|nr:guanylate kinase [Nitrospirota bacterium]
MAGRKQRQGTLFVISAPSGAGKSTLCHQLLHKVRGLKLSVSYTTRPPRKGERNDVDYTFISQKKFKNMINSGEFAEWAMVHGNLYGTSLKRLKKLTKEGYDIILDIDVQGAMQIKKKYDNAVYIFIFPPSMRILKQRLLNRGTDSKDIIDRRLEKARAEITGYKNYDYVIINDKLEKAYKELEGIIVSNRLKTENISDKWIKSLIK